MQIIDPACVERIRAIGVCEWCGKPNVSHWRPHQVSHTFRRGMGGGQQLDHPLNLTLLCADCHLEHHKGNDPKQAALIVMAALREKWPPARALEELYRLRRTVGKDQPK